ncbi:MAG TPA: phosphoribosyltransferase family protein [Burkholderiaceae bacterium]|nr:phosphoribosyltransferase family protein [Burkholderiaceae bacterium]
MTFPSDATPMAAGGAGPSGGRLTCGAGWLARARRRVGGRCAVCRGWCAGDLCGHCASRFALARPRCSGCALALPVADATVDTTCPRCRRAPPPWSRAVAGVDYGYPWDRLLADFKFHQRLDVVDALLQPLLARLQDMRGSGLRVVSVPLSRERLRERGYNQSWELARRLARALALDARADTLLRVRDTGHQLGLQRGARQANLQGAFVVTPRHAAWVRGARIALVDDVLTTGATARAATHTLRAAGACEVQVWTVARTPEA